MLDYSLSDDDPFVFRLNDNGTGPNLLIEVCMERGWRGYQPGNGADDQWNLWWRNGSFPLSQQKGLHKWQFTNHIPKGGSICRKDNLSRLLRCMRKIYGSIYDFSPASYHLPLEYTKLVAECSLVRRVCDPERAPPVWICKPVAQSQGRGIFLFRNLCELTYASTAVVQRYIERPLLVGGYKCDLRLYVCVPSYRPLTAYMYCEGLARFGTDKYTLNDIHNPYRHLTNSSLNKAGPRYAECKDRIGSGCKWTLKQLRRHLCGTCSGRGGGDNVGGGGDSVDWLAWQRVRALVTLTLLAQAAGVPSAHNCFEFFGFDVLLDEVFKPWLIEVNLSPALAHDCEADAVVKRPMLHDLFDLLGLPMRHTGLALYAALARPRPLTRNQDDRDESDTENVDTRAIRTHTERLGALPAPPRSCGRSRGRLRRRRAQLPLKSVVIQPPAATAVLQVDPERHLPKFLSFQHGNGTQDKPQICPFTTEPMQVNFTKETLSAIPSKSENEEFNVSCRRRGSSVSSAAVSASRWGNGVDWRCAPPRVGGWVRIFPHNTTDCKQSYGEGAATTACDVRGAVAAVARFIRAAREAARTPGAGAAGDRERNAALVQAYGEQIEMWMPPR